MRRTTPRARDNTKIGDYGDSEDVVRTVLVDGKLYLRNPDETLMPLRDETDYARLDALSAAEIKSIAETDIEGAPMSDEE